MLNIKEVERLEIVRAGVEDVETVVPLFDAYLQFYKLPSNEEAARRYLHARLLKGEAVIFLAVEERSAGTKEASRANRREILRPENAGTQDDRDFAHERGKALGFTLLYPTWSSLSMKPWWNLNDLYVVPEARQRGVARALLERARRLAEESGASGLGLETGKDNLPAQKLYEQLGWKREEEFFRYELKT
jgi:ribosomal protein S18 acetylase RimI-like enzyme